MIQKFFLFVTLIIFIAAESAELSLQTGDWKFYLDKQTGILRNIVYQNELVLPTASRRIVLGKKGVTRFQLVNHSFAKKKLHLTLLYENWQLEEWFEFDAHNMPGLLRRTARLLLKVGDPAGVEFGNYILTFRTPADLDFYMPFAIANSLQGYGFVQKESDFQDIEQPQLVRGNTRNFKPKTRLTPTFFGSDFLLLRKKTGTALAILTDSRLETSALSLITGENADTLELRLFCGGWAFPGKPQNHLGNFYCLVRPDTTFETIIDKMIPDWYRRLGIHAPNDRPDWVAGGRIYEFRPDAFDEDDRFERLEKSLFPRLKALGYNILYAQPVIPGWNPRYLPVHLDKITARVGSAKEYSQFIAQAQASGFRYLQDIVTHGSLLQENAARKMELPLLTFDRNGKFYNRYLGDYMNPDYRAYLACGAEYLMKLGPNGFRVDMPYGNMPNWRKKGFPSRKTLQQLPPAVQRWVSGWFDRNGSMPELPYERATLGNRSGRLINATLRDIIRKYRKDGAMLSELVQPVQGSWADTIYDLCWVYYVTWYCNTEPAAFVRDIRRFFHEQQKLSPPGTLWTHKFQSHDLIDVYARLGTAAGNCAYALTTLCAGLSMIQEEADIGHGDFIARLNRLSLLRPELRDGNADFLAVKCSAPEIWSVLRHDGKQCSIGLINFSNRTLTSEIRLDPSKVAFLKNKKFMFIDQLDNSFRRKGSALYPMSFQVQLPPFGMRILSSCTTDTAPPLRRQSESAPVENDPVLQEFPDRYEIHSGNYSLCVSRKTGQLEWMKDGADRLLLHGADLIFARNRIPELSVKANKLLNTVTVTTTFSNPQGEVKLEYLCSGQKVTVRGTLSGAPGGEYAYWFLAGDDRNSSWKVNTFDGVMADRIYGEPLQLPRHPHLSNNTFYRDNFYRVQWSSERNPLNPADAVCGLYRQDSRGVLLRFPNGLKDVPPAMEFLTFNGVEKRPGYAIWLHSPSPLLQGIPSSFRMELLPSAAETFSELHSMEAIPINGVTLQSESTGAVISNTHYEVHLRRLGGMIRLLRDRKSGTRLIDRMTLLSRAQHTVHDLTPHYDGFSGCLIREIDGRLYMRYTSHYRRFGRGYQFNQQLQGVQEYWFDSSPVFHAIYSVETPTQYNFSLTLQSTVGDLTTRTTPDGLFFEKKDASVAVDGLNARSVRQDGNFLIATWFDDKNPLPTAKRFRRELSFRLNGAAAKQKAVSLYPAEFEHSLADPSFEILGVACSLRHRKMFPHMLTTLWESLGYRFDTYTCSPLTILYDPNDAADGMVSMVLKGYEGYLSPCFKTALNECPAGRYRLTMAVKSRGNHRPPDLQVSLRGTFQNVPREHRFPVPSIPAESDWHDVTMELLLPYDLTASWLHVMNHEATGTVMFDKIRLEKLSLRQ